MTLIPCLDRKYRKDKSNSDMTAPETLTELLHRSVTPKHASVKENKQAFYNF